MLTLWLLDRDEVLKEKLTLISASHKITINGPNTLNFECTNHVNKNDHVLYQDEMGHWHEFIVQGITENKDSIRVYAEHVSYELHGNYIKERRPNELATVHLNMLLEGTRWTAGVVHNVQVKTSYFYLSIYDCILKLASVANREVQYRIAVNNNRIVERKVDLITRIGQDNGKRFTYSKDLLNATRTILDDSICTALVGRGRGVEIGDGFGRRITFIELDKSDSPIGIEYVYDSQALNEWGILHNGQRLHKIGIVEFDDIEDTEELYQATKQKLQEFKNPRINYEVEVALLIDSHENVQIGDSVLILDQNFRGKELRLSGRVIELEKNLVEPERSLVILGNLRESYYSLAKNNEELLDNFRSKMNIWDRANAFDSNNQISGSYISDMLETWNETINSSGGFIYAEDGKGMITYDRPIDQSPTQAMQLVAGGFRIANSKLSNGEWDWKTVISAEGIAGEQLLANSITASKLAADVGQSLDLSSNTSIRFVVDSAITDIQVGGRNLLLKSDETITLQGVRWTDYTGKKWSEI